jgi:hypothetical protein
VRDPYVNVLVAALAVQRAAEAADTVLPDASVQVPAHSASALVAWTHTFGLVAMHFASFMYVVDESVDHVLVAAFEEQADSEATETSLPELSTHL